ncbi:hypothetical protein [Amycolatopsis sp. NPDC001319]|uniref:hypothetical protein n=1 Tax=unclassified Amycolatopsis TaxID=2618356 RepID=UPI00369040DD
MSRAVYTVTNPLGAAENALVNSLFDGRGKNRRRTAARPAARPAASRSTPAVTTADARAAEGAAAHDQLAELMTVQRERFAPAQRPAVAPPSPVDRDALAQQEWAQLKKNARPWQRARRQELRQEATRRAAERAAAQDAHNHTSYLAHHHEAEAWWAALQRGESRVLTAALVAAFADNPAPVKVVQALEAKADLVLLLPQPAVLPAKKAHVTPTGRLSTKAWTKTEFNEVYAELLGAHLLATARETWAVAPSLTHIRIRGIRAGIDGTEENLFDVSLDRTGWPWHDDTCGSTILRNSRRGLNRVGRTAEVRRRPAV